MENNLESAFRVGVTVLTPKNEPYSQYLTTPSIRYENNQNLVENKLKKISMTDFKKIDLDDLKKFIDDKKKV